MQEESAIEARMDFVMLSPLTLIIPTATATTHISRPSQEEQKMWEDHEYSNKIFNAGIDHMTAAAEERKHLEQEATDFDLWRSADFLPEEDPTHSELLLNELEQDDILAELLQNTCMHTSQFHQCIPMNGILLDRFESSLSCRFTK